ncbi:CLUMA_CG009144, isoform A [Clunio marinus]|uniref:CLUMA_CG009144, isoform A n=1 Tax=Clunio marinus TaxID=568069 RepID=A0A1J1I9P2_9DIPT|nr:CLUMA_CG009144, isoform A [Clunio marinus]
MKTLLVFVLTVQFLLWQAHSVEFRCEFGYRLDHGYPCQVTKGLLVNDNEAVTFVGNHQAGKDDNDLKLISFSGNRHLRLHYFPRETFSKFPHLDDFSLQNCQLRNLKNGDFKDAGNLRNLNLDSNELFQLNSTTFAGASNLQWLGLASNDMRTINKDAFKGLSKLQMLILSQNKLHELHRETFHDLVDLLEILVDRNELETLPAGLFDRSLKLQRIWFQNNKINVIDPQFFTPLQNIKFINLEGNVCVNELFRKQYRETEVMLTDALKNCNPTPTAKTSKN